MLPKKLKPLGWILIILGSALGTIRFYFGIKPEFLNVKVFAIYSKYFETSYFKIISNHISEEITALFFLVGLFLISFTEEKIENDDVAGIRLKSLLITFFINTVFLMLSFLFVYGFGFINILVINVFSPFIIYFIVFRLLKLKVI